LSAARAEKATALESLSLRSEGTWGDIISPVSAKVIYLEQVMGRIERETKRRIDRNAKILSRKSAAAKSRQNAQAKSR